MDGPGHAPVVELVGQPGITFSTFSNHSRHRRTELDSCCLILEDTGPIRFGTMMNDYREVVAVLKDRGRVLLLRIGLFRIVFKWVKPRFSANFYRHRRGLN
jgi:hypothetical protein